MAPRHSFTLRLMAFLKDRPNVWIPAIEFEQFGRQAWRSRISDARRRFRAANDGDIENSVTKVNRTKLSLYRYVPPSAVEQRRGHDLNEFGLR